MSHQLMPRLISSVYGVVVTSENGGDKAQYITTEASRNQE